MTWKKMTPEQRDALVVEKVMGWQWIPAGRYGPHVKDGTSWLLPERGLSAITSDQGADWVSIGGDKFIPRNWIPRYTTSMDAAWQVMQQMGARFNPKDMYAYEPFIPFTNELFGTENEELYPSYRYMGEQIAKWTPDRICLAALRAVGYEDL